MFPAVLADACGLEGHQVNRAELFRVSNDHLYNTYRTRLVKKQWTRPY